MKKSLLLLSSSRVGDTGYLEHALPQIESFIDSQKQQSLLFIPYAGVSISFDQYEDMVNRSLSKINLAVKSIHHFTNKKEAIEQSSGILVGGGNTFALLNQLYLEELIEPIKNKINSGTPYIGWSAGSNIAAPTIMTTNDMPILEPPSFKALGLVPWQINPHYIDGNPPGHNGETRQQRLEEYLVVNPESNVIGIPEGTGLKIGNNQIDYIGEKVGFLFNQQGKSPFKSSDELNELLS